MHASGETLRVRICNNLDRFVDTYDNPPVDYSVLVPPDNPNPYPAVSHEVCLHTVGLPAITLTITMYTGSMSGCVRLQKLGTLCLHTPPGDRPWTEHVGAGAQNNDKKDPNILASHLHGFYGNPGTNASACDPPLDPGIPCWRGDNIFHNILPGACADYQYDFTPYHSPGVFWLHPHK